MIHARIFALALLAAGALAHAAPAQATLYDDLGGKDKIVAFTNDFVERINADPRIQKYFAHADLAHLKYELAEQFCSLAQGPCQYTGKDMVAAHKGMELRDADFNALAEDLQFAMDAANIPFPTQNRLVALLAPMHGEIVGE